MPTMTIAQPGQVEKLYSPEALWSITQIWCSRFSKGSAAKTRLLHPRKKFAQHGAHFSLTRFSKGSAAKIRNYGTRGINPRRASGLKRTCRVIERTLLLRVVSLALEPIVAATVAVRASLGTRVTVMDAESGFAIVPRLHVATLLAMGQELGLA